MQFKLNVKFTLKRMIVPMSAIAYAPSVVCLLQVGGYTTATDKLTYATVRDAGHEVPTFQPLRAYNMFNAFLNGLL